MKAVLRLSMTFLICCSFTALSSERNHFEAMVGWEKAIHGGLLFHLALESNQPDVAKFIEVNVVKLGTDKAMFTTICKNKNSAGMFRNAIIRTNDEGLQYTVKNLLYAELCQQAVHDERPDAIDFIKKIDL